jgi:hypothetical protein
MNTKSLLIKGAVALGGLGLLGTLGAALATSASAATVTPHAATSGHAITREYGVDDTTSVYTGKVDPTGNGPIWAYDNVTRQITWHADPTTSGAWDVTVATFGTYHAFANPITGAAWKHDGVMVGEIQYVVTSPTPPSAANLPAVSPNTLRSQGIADELFGQQNNSPLVTMTGGAYNFVYVGIPGAPGGLYFQH